ncbi:MAG: LysM peptidoglycan-binding domain-containing protein [Armatimonadota bacterium]
MEIHDSRLGRRRRRRRRAVGALLAMAVAGAALAAAGRLPDDSGAIAPTVATASVPRAMVAVRPGDTLGAIAERIGPTDWSSAEKTARLQEANPRADLLTPGQLLRDPWR